MYIRCWYAVKIQIKPKPQSQTGADPYCRHVIGPEPVSYTHLDVYKRQRFIDGVVVAGTRDDIPELVRKKGIDAIYVALPSAPVDDIKDILGICQKTGCQVKYLPGVYQLMNGEVNISRLKEVEIEDLLGREPVQVLSLIHIWWGEDSI